MVNNATVHVNKYNYLLQNHHSVVHKLLKIRNDKKLLPIS